MEITDIKMTKKGRYALFCGKEFLFSIDEDTYVSFGIKKGIDLTEEELTELRKRSDYRKAVDKAFSFLGVRDHSEYELFSKLLRNFDEETAGQAVGRIKELGYLDDRAFAERYRDELLRKKSSITEVRRKFSEKRISREITDDVLGMIEDDEKSIIRELIDKKYLRKLTAEDGRQKVYASLMRKGFRSSDITAVLNELGETDGGYGED